MDQWRIVHWKWQDCTQVIFFPPNIFVPMNASRRAKPYMYCQPFARTNSFFYSFVPHTISAWNALPGYVTDMTTPSTFKNALFLHYIHLKFNMFLFCM